MVEGVAEIAEAWLRRFEDVLGGRDFSRLDELFVADCWWRDLLAFTWDLRTFHGIEAIASGLAPSLEATPAHGFRLSEAAPPVVRQVYGRRLIQAFLDFETDVSSVRAFVRLVPTDDDWKAWTLLTQTEQLLGFEEKVGWRRSKGVEHGELPERRSWLEEREHSREFLDDQPQVVVVGAGQSGLSVGARLGRLDVSTLILEQNPRVGDNWRKRYPSLALHDPVWADHLPYLAFPPNWPVFTPKDKLGDWLEAYAAAMELNVWTGVAIAACRYDERARRWSIEVRRPDGSERVLTPHHLVFATGGDAEPRVPELEGIERFRGSVMHSSDYPGGRAWRGKRALVIGAGTSGHDIAQDFYEQGAETVTIVQRSPTLVLSTDRYLATLDGVFGEDAPPVELGDLIDASVPINLLLELHKEITRENAHADREILEGLRSAGFQLTFGPNDAGVIAQRLAGGPYYIDVGASRLIAGGKVALASNVGVTRFREDGVELDDGTFVAADVVVLATGYLSIRESVRRVVGDEIDRCDAQSGLDDEGEIRLNWRPSGHERLWFMAGSLRQARFYSKLLALQIKAIEEGVRPGASARLPATGAPAR